MANLAITLRSNYLISEPIKYRRQMRESWLWFLGGLGSHCLAERFCVQAVGLNIAVSVYLSRIYDDFM